jgi:aconitate hydratase
MYFPENKVMPVYDAAEKYRESNTPLIILAGRDYGSGSSRDWAAKGTTLLGVKAVIAESFERIHRSNLVGMGVLPVQLLTGVTINSLGLKGDESYDIMIPEELRPKQIIKINALSPEGKVTEFYGMIRLDSNTEISYYRNSGILQFVLRKFLKNENPADSE